MTQATLRPTAPVYSPTHPVTRLTVAGVAADVLIFHLASLAVVAYFGHDPRAGGLPGISSLVTQVMASLFVRVPAQLRWMRRPGGDTYLHRVIDQTVFHLLIAGALVYPLILTLTIFGYGH